MKKSNNNAKYEKLSQHFYKDIDTDSTSLIVNSVSALQMNTASTLFKLIN